MVPEARAAKSFSDWKFPCGKGRKAILIGNFQAVIVNMVVDVDQVDGKQVDDNQESNTKEDTGV